MVVETTVIAHRESNWRVLRRSERFVNVCFLRNRRRFVVLQFTQVVTSIPLNYSAHRQTKTVIAKVHSGFVDNEW